jgi:hypothetical protein
MSYWKTNGGVAAAQVKRVVGPLMMVFSRGEPKPPVRPHVFTIVDEQGVEREVFAPRGYVTQLRDFEHWLRR